MLERLHSFSSGVMWRACRQVSNSNVLDLVKELGQFDSKALKELDDKFIKFLPQLYTSVSMMRYNICGSILMS